MAIVRGAKPKKGRRKGGVSGERDREVSNKKNDVTLKGVVRGNRADLFRTYRGRRGEER